MQLSVANIEQSVQCSATESDRLHDITFIVYSWPWQRSVSCWSSWTMGDRFSPLPAGTIHHWFRIYDDRLAPSSTLPARHGAKCSRSC